MRLLLILFTFFFFTNCFAQIIIDKTIENTYKTELRQSPLDLQKRISELDKDTISNWGTVIMTEYYTDTINKSELNVRDLSHITILDIDPKTNKPIKNKSKLKKKEHEYPILFCSGQISNDTLAIEIGYPFSNQTINHWIYKNQIKTTYSEYYKYDTVLKSDINTIPTNDLTIPSETIKFMLNDTTFILGKTIYGYAEIITNSYYLKDSWEENQFFKLRCRIKYYFKFRVTKTATS